MVPEPGTQLGIYRLTQRLGAGGMGEVWKAEDTRLHRSVAIKLLPTAMTGDEESRARLLREARTAGQLYHPNIATIHNIELDGDSPYIVMEFVEGESLTRAIGSRRLTEAAIAEVGRGIADALAEAHAKGIVHRDIKPDNVMLAGNRVKVLDFGIAKRYGEGDRPVGEIVTEAGVVLGTMNYMSPEQAMGKSLDGRSDIFSLGVMLYQALAGQLPFRGNTGLETLKQILRNEPPDLRTIAPNRSPEMAGIVARCLKKQPEERYQNASELAQELARIAARNLVETPPRPLVVPQQHPADSSAITAARAAEPSRGLPATDEAPTVVQAMPTQPGLTRPAVTVVNRDARKPPVPSFVQPTAPPGLAPLPPAPVTSAELAQPEPSSTMPWLIAGMAFVVVLAVAGGFLAARIFVEKSPAAHAIGSTAPVTATQGVASTAVPATPSSAQATRPLITTTIAPAAPQQAPVPSTIRPVTQQKSAPIVTTSAVSAPPTQPPAYAEPAPTPTGAKDSYRAGMDYLEASNWHYLDSIGQFTSGAELAEPMFQTAIDSEPDHPSARLRLAVTKLFRRRFDAAKKDLYPMLASDRISFEERTIASFAYSASAIAANPGGGGSKEFESSLDQALTYYGKSPEFAAFAQDVRWLVKRSGR